MRSVKFVPAVATLLGPAWVLLNYVLRRIKETSVQHTAEFEKVAKYVCDEETKHLAMPMDTWMWFDAFARQGFGPSYLAINIFRGADPCFSTYLLTLNFPEVEGKAFKRNAQYSPEISTHSFAKKASYSLAAHS